MTNSVVDLFKNVGETRAKKELGADNFYNNRSVYSKNYVKNTYKNTTNTFAELMNNDDISSVRLIDTSDNSIHMFDKSSSNRMQYFYFKNKKIDYKEITRVEKINADGYSHLVAQGYNNFYNLYKLNEFNNEYLLCVLAFVE